MISARFAEGKLAVALALLRAADGVVVAGEVASTVGLPLRAVIVGARALRADGYVMIDGYGPDARVELTPAGRDYLTGSGAPA